jgi:hypothetical protein
MKKSLIALAALAAVTAASAQSTVTLSGTYRFAYQKDLSTSYNSATANTNFAQLGGSSASTSATAVREGKSFTVTDANLKLAAVEDLGGGLKASFDYLLETGAFRGAAVTRADSGIGVSGGFGAIAMRNTRQSDLIASIGSAAINLPDGLYDNSGILPSRASIDTVSYTSPTISGFTGSITYVELNDGAINLAGTNAVPANTSVYVLGGAYANGPLMVTAAYKMAPADKTATTGITPKANVELAVTYDLGVAKVAFAHDGASAEGTSSAGISSSGLTPLSALENQAIANAQTKAGNGFSVTVPLGAVTVGMNYFKRDVVKLTEFGVSYAFSKRTSAGFATGTKSGLTETQGFKGTQYRAGLTHTF